MFWQASLYFKLSNFFMGLLEKDHCLMQESIHYTRSFQGGRESSADMRGQHKRPTLRMTENIRAVEKLVKSEYYVDVLKRFLNHKRPEKISNGWLFHQDNARPHTSIFTMEFM